MARTRLITVLGMHRSGTSVLTRSLLTLSVGLGGNLMSADETQNAKGFWEDLDIVNLNERVLRKVGSGWHHLGPVDRTGLVGAELSDERLEAAEVLGAKLGKYEVFGFKDPRTAILLPFWQCVLNDLDIKEEYLVSVRNPLEVADSLRRRNQIHLEKGVALWMKHLVSILLNTEGRRRLFVDYDALLQHPRTQMERIAKSFELSLPGAQSESYKAYAKKFLDANLKHHEVSLKELHRSIAAPDIVIDFYTALQAWCRVETSSQIEIDPKLLERLNAYVSNTAPMAVYADKLTGLANSREAQVNDLDRRLKAETEVSRSLREKARAETSELRDILQQRDEENGKLRSALLARTEDIVRSSQESALANQSTLQDLKNSLEKRHQAELIAASERSKSSLETEKQHNQAERHKLELDFVGQLERLRVKHSAELSAQRQSLTARLTQAEEERVLEIEALEKRHKSSVADAKAQHEMRIQALQCGFDMKLEDALRIQWADAESLRQSLVSRLEAVERNHQTQKRDLVSKHNSELNALSIECEAEKQKWELQARGQLNQVNQKHEGEKARWQERVNQLCKDLKERDGELQKRALLLEQQAGRISELTQSVDDLNKKRIGLSAEVRRLSEALSEVTQRMRSLHVDLRKTKGENQRLKHSTSWRLTKPIRTAVRYLRQIKGK